MREQPPVLFNLTRGLATLGTVALAACGMPAQSTRLADGPEPVELRIEPAVLRAGQQAVVVVRSAGADSIAIVSLNGVDRFWGHGPTLTAKVGWEFGDPTPIYRHAERRNGVLLSRLKKPATISVCNQGRCREFHHEFEVALPERNERSVAVTGGWSTVFARRSVTGRNQMTLFRKALSSSVVSIEGELAARSWGAKVHGFYGADSRGASLDLSRVVKQAGEVSYGVAMHVGAARSEWLPDGRRPALAERTAYRVSVGPAIMLRGITASSQFGVYASGRETLQVIGTRISANGRLTSVRLPVSVTAEKTLAFGGGPIVSRRRDAYERLTAAIHLVDHFALNLGVSSHRIAWPADQATGDLRASEVIITLGGQYAPSW